MPKEKLWPRVNSQSQRNKTAKKVTADRTRKIKALVGRLRRWRNKASLFLRNSLTSQNRRPIAATIIRRLITRLTTLGRATPNQLNTPQYQGMTSAIVWRR